MVTRHPLSEVMGRGQAAGDALRALVTRQATEPDLTPQQRLEVSVALDQVRRAMAPLARQRDAGIRMAAQRLMAALDDGAAPAVEKSA
jgi:ubiquitin